MSSSKLAGALKHPVWISVATVVGVLALVVIFIQMGSGDKPAELVAADVTFGNPTPIEALAGPAGEEPETVTEAATPLDIALKNNGDTAVRITRIDTRVLDVADVDCSMQGGGTNISAFFGVKVPFVGGDAGRNSVVSTPVDYTVKAGSVDRMEVTIGPETILNSRPVVVAAQLSLVPEQGEAIDLDPIALSQPDLVDAQIPINALYSGSYYERCWQVKADALDRIFEETKFQSPDAIRLRDNVRAMASQPR